MTTLSGQVRFGLKNEFYMDETLSSNQMTREEIQRRFIKPIEDTFVDSDRVTIQWKDKTPNSGYQAVIQGPDRRRRPKTVEFWAADLFGLWQPVRDQIALAVFQHLTNLDEPLT